MPRFNKVLQSFLNSYSCNSVLIVQPGWIRYCWSFITIWNRYYKMLSSTDKSQALSFVLELEWWGAKLLRQKCNLVCESSVWKCYLVLGNYCFTVFYLPVPCVPEQLRWITSKFQDDLSVQGNSDAREASSERPGYWGPGWLTELFRFPSAPLGVEKFILIY